MSKVFYISLAVFVLYVGYKTNSLFELPPLPTFEKNEWWGSGKPVSTKPEVRSFTIKISDEVGR